MAIVYRHIRLDKNEPFYIGIGKDVKRAYSKHSRSTFWKKIVSKTDYEVEILFDDLTWDEACDKEKEFIKLYGRKDIGTGILANMTDGGEGMIGYKHSEETKLQNSINKKGNKYWVGKTHKEDSKKKISESKKGHSVNKGKSHPAWNKGNRKVDPDIIKNLYNSGMSQTDISNLYNINQGYVSKIINNKR